MTADEIKAKGREILNSHGIKTKAGALSAALKAAQAEAKKEGIIISIDYLVDVGILLHPGDSE